MVKATERKYLILFVAATLGIVLIDQVTKILVAVKQPSWSRGFLSIHFVQNTGAGFGILKGQMTILAIVSIVVVMGVIFFYNKIPQKKWAQLLFGLFLGGVAGNLIDRILRQYVVDFIDVGFWPVFNIADAAISVSVIGLVLYYWKKK
ncbi:MAG TPA: signal peptidase II [Candidatus Nanoarchaeia archaeon]|nr:signal peptidase II [Candidatus Nanoarchaeia archaeon]